MSATAEELQLHAVGTALGDVHWKVGGTGEHIGVYERARNDGPRIRLMLEAAGIDVAAPWCAAACYLWISDACAELGQPNPLEAVPLKALVQSYVNWARENELLIGAPERRPGDLVCFSFGGERYDHIGLLHTADPLRVVEGNTFLDDGDDDAPGQRGEREGYEVEVKDRRLGYARRTLFIRWTAANETLTGD